MITPGVAVRQATVADLHLLVPLFDAYRQFYRQPSDPAGAHRFLLERFAHNQSVSFSALCRPARRPSRQLILQLFGVRRPILGPRNRLLRHAKLPLPRSRRIGPASRRRRLRPPRRCAAPGALHRSHQYHCPGGLRAAGSGIVSSSPTNWRSETRGRWRRLSKSFSGPSQMLGPCGPPRAISPTPMPSPLPWPESPPSRRCRIPPTTRW